ncbi:hypothetical protein ZIOFF_041431 [Zingiber officinale]|uniref:Uncharacterized protein n=1 Tax=Zingiber officinale TaxID=94328 RepID=A0A8J5L5U5_ZINOF|nr:hypothetical protein ZIOFF_041431 [Zingiber officinale]
MVVEDQGRVEGEVQQRREKRQAQQEEVGMGSGSKGAENGGETTTNCGQAKGDEGNNNMLMLETREDRVEIREVETSGAREENGDITCGGDYHQNIREQITGYQEVAEEFVYHFEGILGLDVACMPLGSTAITGAVLTVSPQKMLVAAISSKEIQVALFDIGSDRAPGPDGYGSIFFSNQLGQRLIDPPAPPSYDRSSVPANDAYSKFFSSVAADAQNMESMMVQIAPPNAVIGTVMLTVDDLRKLKEMVSTKVNDSAFRCSNIVATYAYAWVSLVKARGHNEDTTAHMAFPGNCRERIQPPLPAEYFSNYIGGNFVHAKAVDLAGEDGVAAAARLIGEAIEQFKEDPLKDAAKWMDRYQAIALQRPLSVAGSPGFKIYDVDFGWGRPVKVDMPSISWGGPFRCRRAEMRSAEWKSVWWCPKTEMDEFEAHFSNGLKLLQ